MGKELYEKKKKKTFVFSIHVVYVWYNLFWRAENKLGFD